MSYKKYYLAFVVLVKLNIGEQQHIYICAHPASCITIMTQNKLFLILAVCIVLTSLFALFKGVYICARPVISVAVVSQMQFSRKTSKS